MATRAVPGVLLAVAFALAVGGCSAQGDPPAGRRDGGPDAGMDGGPGPDGGPRDGGADAAPCAEIALCGGECADLATDPDHCGGCGTVCEAPAEARALCTDGACGFACLNGFVEEGGACVQAPRLLWPPSLSTVTSAQPRLRWALPDGAGDSTVELCAERACTTVIERIEASGVTEAVPEAPLPRGSVFWRVTAGGRGSNVWMFRAGARPLDGVDHAWGVYPDYDGDGYGDVVVGAPRVGDREGRAYLYLGGPSGTPSAPDRILYGPDGAQADFAIAIAHAGDLDGDGYGDLAIGAPRAEEAAGRVHVFFGGPSGFGAAPDVTLESPGEPGSLFGASLAGVGDVDGDGYGDLLVGAPGEGVMPGRAHLFRGGRLGPEAAPSGSWVGAGRFASAVAGAGDVDGDGYADVLIGAPQGAGGAGQAHLLRGGEAGLPAAIDRTWDGTSGAGSQFGVAMAGLGDVNGDGWADFAVAAPAADTARGAVHVFHGGADLPEAPTLTVLGASSGGAFFGQSIAGAGDANGDGYADLVVGAFGVNGRRGRVTLVLGGAAGLRPTERVSVDGASADGDLGWAVGGAGDVDGNGRADLVAGAPGVNRAHVYRGGPSGLVTMPLVTLSGAREGAFGRSVAHADR